MRAATIIAPGQLEIQQVPRPSPGPRQVLVRLEGCGVCASNLPVWEGRPWFSYPRPPGSPGHEGWGVIEEVGADVQGWRTGERVAGIPQQAFAEFDVAEADELVRLPRELGRTPFLGEPLACAMNVFARSDIQPGQHVAIVGVGFLGALLTRLTAAEGAHVTAVSRRAFARELARRQGAETTIEFDSAEHTAGAAREITGGKGFARVIEAVGNQAALDLAGALVQARGRLIIAGYHQSGPRTVNMQQWNWNGIDVINAHERDPAVYTAGMRAAMDAVLSGRLDPQPLITHSFPLQELPAAFEMLAARPEGFLKAVVTM